MSFSPSIKKIKLKKSIFLGCFILVLVGVVTVVYFAFIKAKTITPSPINNHQKQTNKKIIKFIATGDMIPHDAINQEAEQVDGSYSYAPMFGDMKTVFDSSDLRFCNQAVLGGGVKFGISGYPKFNSPTDFTNDMARLGCNLINTGSNHTNDFNQAVISASVEAWQGLPNIYAVAGANTSESEMQKVHYFEIKGVKFAFVSYTTYSNEPSPSGFSVTMYSDQLAQKQVTEAKSKADIVIVSMRWGNEYSAEANTSQKLLAGKLTNYGADIILGHGSHVLQPMEKLSLDDGRQAFVWYSLGNFLNAQLDPPSLFNGIAVMQINTDTKKISVNGYLPIYMHYEWTAEQKAKGNLMARHNFKLYTFDDGQSALAKSQNNTTIEEQTKRIKDIFNKMTPVDILSKNQYFQL